MIPFCNLKLTAQVPTAHACALSVSKVAKRYE